MSFFGAVVGDWWGYHAASLGRVPVVTLKALPPDCKVLFFLNVSVRVEDDIVERYECINFHAAPLPFGRGGHPIENLIKLGHQSTVITAHEMTSELDAGPIYLTRGPISLSGTKADIQERFIEPVALMMVSLKKERWRQPQIGELVTFERLSPEDYAAFWEARG